MMLKRMFCVVHVMLKVMSDGVMYVTSVVEGDVCVEQTEGEKKHIYVFNMCLLVAILASNVCFNTSAAKLLM